MSCSNNNRCGAKSCVRYYNNNSQALAAGSSLQLVVAGSKVVDSGVAIEVEPQNYTIVKPGLYHISGDVVLDASAAGEVTFEVYRDGVALPCTIKTVTVAAGLNEIHTETDISVCGCCGHSFAFMLIADATAAGNVTQLCTGVLKLA